MDAAELTRLGLTIVSLDWIQRSLDAAGIHDADPAELPERIAELRFAGPTVFVPSGEYPRRGAAAEQAPEVLRRRRPDPKSNSESLVEQQAGV